MSEPVLQKTAVTTKVKSLFKQKSFLLLWVSTIFSGLSFSMFYFAEAWYVVQELNLEASLGIIYIIGAIPRIIFMLLGGVLADRLSQSKIMFFSNLTKAILIGGLVLLLFTGEINFWTLIIFALFFGVLDAFFWPASSSITPVIVPKEFLTRANSVIQTTSQATSILGPMISGFIIVGFDYTGIFSLITILLILGSCFIFFIKVNKKVVNTQENKHHLLLSLKEGINYVKKAPILMAFLLKTLFLNLFFIGPLTIGVPIFVKNILKGQTIDYSFIMSFLAIGMVLGSIILGIINLKRKRGILSLTSQMFVGLCFLILSFSNEIWQSVVIVVFLGISMTISNICAVSVVQNEAEPEMIGRVMSIQTVSSMGLTPISYGLTSLSLSLEIDIKFIIMAGALSLIAFTLYIYFKIPALRTVE
ncbi:MFS transporter [Bacillus thuringiensis]|uniref:MFS transporter n=1 Tax=Bacillus thuringiensis TaxID=1428 RepID=UPI001BE3E9EA|nr:MFS transporter [Bacillus thuringiensis]MBT2201914.1 MFS transporter [Bacillus thuringiensis]